MGQVCTKSSALITRNCPHKFYSRTMHDKCRAEFYPRTDNKVKRFSFANEFVPWSVPFDAYKPVEYTDPKILSGPVFADPATLGEAEFCPSFNSIDGKIDRNSYMGSYQVVDHRPLNPIGRTGITGRGCLGRWGPNHAADPIVTRWRRDSSGAISKDATTKKQILECVFILRGDCKEWAIPGGMVDPGENVSVTLRREFGEEALNSLQCNQDEKHHVEGKVDPGETAELTALREFCEESMNSKVYDCAEMKIALRPFFEKPKFYIYKGYVDDPRNTDNAWMETVAMNFHDESGEAVGKIKLNAGDDAVGVQWKDVGSNLSLYASHKDFISEVAQRHNAHW